MRAARDSGWAANLEREEAARAESLRASTDPASAELLREEMSEISEELYCAGWLHDLEFVLWGMLNGADRGFGMGDVAEAEIASLRRLHEKCGGWWRWDDGVDGEVFVATEEWLRIVGARHPAPEVSETGT